MRAVLKKLVPASLFPAVQQLYWKIFSGRKNPAFTRQVRRDLPALKCVIGYNEYGAYCIPESARYRPAARSILNHFVWEPDTIQFMKEHCGAGDIVHAGTFFGDFLPALSRSLAPDALLWAFEPNRENYRCARVTVELNELDNVRLTHAGLGARPDTLHIQTTDELGRSLGGASRILDEPADGELGSDEVRILTIDDIIGANRSVSIIQLDVEGHERQALAGALETIARHRPILILEILTGSELLQSSWFDESVLCHGYRKGPTLHANAVYLPQDTGSARAHSRGPA